MLSIYFVMGFLPIQLRKGGMMKQLSFEFVKEINQEVDIGLSPAIEDQLIEQMAIVMIQVNKGGKSEDDDPTTK